MSISDYTSDKKLNVKIDGVQIDDGLSGFVLPFAIRTLMADIAGSKLGDINALTPTDGNIIVGNGTTWVAESGATARTSLGLGTGNTPTFAGVNFGGNNLNKYEEGTFTATAADAETGGNTGTSATASYTRIGRMVFCQIRLLNIDTTGMTGANDLWIRGLPYQASVLNFGAFGDIHAIEMTYTGVLSAGLSPSNPAFRLRETVSATGQDWVTVSEVSSGVSDLFISLAYFV